MEPCAFGLFRKIGLQKYVLASAGPLLPSMSVRLGLPSIGVVSYVPGKRAESGASLLATISGFYNPPPVRMTLVQRAANLVSFVMTQFLVDWMLSGDVYTQLEKHYPDFCVYVSCGLSEETSNECFQGGDRQRKLHFRQHRRACRVRAANQQQNFVRRRLWPAAC